VNQHETVVVGGEPLSPEGEQLIEYLRSRAAAMSVRSIYERIRAAANEIEALVAGITEEESRRRPVPGKWTIAEVVDHIAQTQIRACEELRHLLAGRCPPGPPVYEALRSAAPNWAPWQELVDGLFSANREIVNLLAVASEGAEPAPATARTILVITRKLPDGSTGPQIFIAELNWREYALVQRLHLLDHRTQIKNLRASGSGASAASSLG